MWYHYREAMYSSWWPHPWAAKGKHELGMCTQLCIVFFTHIDFEFVFLLTYLSCMTYSWTLAMVISLSPLMVDGTLITKYGFIFSVLFFFLAYAIICIHSREWLMPYFPYIVKEIYLVLFFFFLQTVFEPKKIKNWIIVNFSACCDMRKISRDPIYCGRNKGIVS